MSIKPGSIARVQLPHNAYLLFIFSEVEHHIILAVVEIVLAQRICHGLVEALTISHNVDCGIYGLTHGIGLCDALPGNVVARAMVGAGANYRQSGSEIHAFAHR